MFPGGIGMALEFARFPEKRWHCALARWNGGGQSRVAENLLGPVQVATVATQTEARQRRGRQWECVCVCEVNVRVDLMCS